MPRLISTAAEHSSLSRLYAALARSACALDTLPAFGACHGRPLVSNMEGGQCEEPYRSSRVRLSAVQELQRLGKALRPRGLAMIRSFLNHQAQALLAEHGAADDRSQFPDIVHHG